MKKFTLNVLLVATIGIMFVGAILFMGVPSRRVHALPVGNWIDVAATDFGGGDGSYGSPWIISTPEHLARMAQQVNITGVGGNAARSGYFVITQHIDLGTRYWTPISTNTTLANVFQGNLSAVPGVEIRNLTIDVDDGMHFVGLFGSLGTNSVIDGINFVNASVTSSAGPATGVGGAGFLAGQIVPSNHADPYVSISNITVDADSVISTADVTNIRTGGIIGSISGAEIIVVEIEDVVINGTIISATNGTGAIVGGSSPARHALTIDNADIDVKFEIESAIVGGVIGSFGPSNNTGPALTITNSSVQMDVEWTGTGGGIAGVLGAVASSSVLDLQDFTRTAVTIENVVVQGDIDFVSGFAANRSRIIGAVQGIYNHIIIDDVWTDGLTNNHVTPWTSRAVTIPANLTSSFIGWIPTNAGQIEASQNIIDIRQAATIQFNTGSGGQTMTPLAPQYGLTPTNFTFTLPNTIPTVGGNHNFVGWSTTPGGAIEYDPGDQITVAKGIHTLHAITDQITHIVRFYNQGTEYTTRSIAQGENLTEWIVPTSTPTSHVFSHWANYVQGTTPPGTVIEFREGDTLQINNPITFYAHWTANTYRVYVRWLPGNVTETFLFEHVHGTPLPATLTSIHDRGAGFYFDGLTLGNTEIFDGEGDRVFTTGWNITGNQVLDAQWGRNTFNINFDSDGGSAVGPISGLFEDNLTIPTDPTRDGHTFLGWAITAGGAVAYEEGDQVAVHAANRTLFARWQINSYTITFNVRGGSAVSSATQNFETTLTLTAPAHVSTLAHYDFLGWATSEARAINGDVDYAIGANVTFTGDRTLWAVRELTTYTVTFNTGAGSAVTAETGTVNETFNAPSSNLAHNDFLGWAITEDGAVVYEVGDTVIITGNRTLWARWQLTTYTVTFNTRGGSTVDSESLTVGVLLLTTIHESDLAHNDFMGWATSEARAIAGDVDYIAGANVTVDGNRTLWAVWQLTTYTVAFNTQGGSSITAETGTINETFILVNEPLLLHNDFKGWAISEARANEGYIDYETGDTVTITGNRTLWAVWEGTSYDLIFNVRGGSAVTTISRNFNTQFTLTTTQESELSHHDFMGWATSEARAIAGDVDYEIGDNVLITGNRTLWAVWQLTTYTLTFDSRDGSAISQVQQTVGVLLLTSTHEPSRDHFDFLGWAITLQDAIDGNVNYEIGDNVNINANRTLFAVWSAVQYTITFNTGAGSNVGPITNIHGHQFVATQPTRDHYDFIGWSATDGGTVLYVPTAQITITGSRTLWAIWQEVAEYTINFNTGPGSNIGNITVAPGGTFVLVNEPTRTGHTFLGWATASGGAVVYRTGDTITVQANRQLFAVWEANANEGLDDIVYIAIGGAVLIMLIAGVLFIIILRRSNRKKNM